MTGKAEVGEIVIGPVPIANSIVSSPGAAFASSTASRRVQVASQVPSPGSAAELTVKTAPAAVAATAGENSDVLSAASVAVAVTNAPGATGGAGASVKENGPAPELREPRKVAPSPLPEGSAAALE